MELLGFITKNLHIKHLHPGLKKKKQPSNDCAKICQLLQRSIRSRNARPGDQKTKQVIKLLTVSWQPSTKNQTNHSQTRWQSPKDQKTQIHSACTHAAAWSCCCRLDRDTKVSAAAPPEDSFCPQLILCTQIHQTVYFMTCLFFIFLHFLLSSI